ncbi:MAG: DNA polymerase III subunit delta, partial [Longimicrobiales bacterium]|nr:DNA polymerase III subunit delta [Longimicrobiales bacterium]
MTSSGSVAGEATGGAFFLHGADEFRKEEAARELIEQHLEPATSDFNFDRYRGGELDIETLASTLATPPMMAEWRVVVLREAEALAQSSRARDVILGAVKDPPPGLAFILLATIPERSSARFYKDLKKLARSTEFAEIAQSDVPGWLMMRAEEGFGVTLDEDAARALGAAVGSDLGILAQELDKLSEMVGDAERITLADVEAAGTHLPKQDRWGWFDMVGERRFDEALEGLPVLLSQRGESGVGLTIGLTRHLLRLGVAAEGGKRAVEEILPPHIRGWLGSKLAGQARGWTAE